MRNTSLTQQRPERERGRSLQKVNPALAKEWHDSLNGRLTPAQVLRTDTRPVYWLCQDCQHIFKNSVKNRHYNRSGCPKCARLKQSHLKRLATFERSLAYLNPYLMKEWHPDLNQGLNAFEMHPKTGAKVWWRCQKDQCAHEWQATVGQRVSRQSGCPKCAKRRQSVGSYHPHLIIEWSSRLNEGFSLYDLNRWSNRLSVWQCPSCLNHWEATIQSRIQGACRCPHCRPFLDSLGRSRIYLQRRRQTRANRLKIAYTDKRRQVVQSNLLQSVSAKDKKEGE